MSAASLVDARPCRTPATGIRVRPRRAPRLRRVSPWLNVVGLLPSEQLDRPFAAPLAVLRATERSVRGALPPAEEQVERGELRLAIIDETLAHPVLTDAALAEAARRLSGTGPDADEEPQAVLTGLVLDTRSQAARRAELGRVADRVRASLEGARARRDSLRSQAVALRWALSIREGFLRHATDEQLVAVLYERIAELCAEPLGSARHEELERKVADLEDELEARARMRRPAAWGVGLTERLERTVASGTVALRKRGRPSRPSLPPVVVTL